MGDGCSLYDSTPDRTQDRLAEPVPKCQVIGISGQAMVPCFCMLVIDRYPQRTG